jgi:preprotein translocase subunit YajC
MARKMARAETVAELATGDTITVDCGCIANIIHLRRDTVTAKVVVPCTDGQNPGVIIHHDPKTVTKTAQVTP